MATRAEALEAKLEAARKKLEEAKKAERELQAQKEKLLAKQKAREAKIERAKDTRRKILLGALLLSKWSKEQIAELVGTGLTREDDRALFGLDPLPGAAPTPPKAKPGRKRQATDTPPQEPSATPTTEGKLGK